ncbi:MAG: DUF4436 family protein [Acidimicrobiales bacterium]
MADIDPSASVRSSRRPWAVGVVALVLFIGAGALVIAAVPHQRSGAQGSKFTVSSILAGAHSGGHQPALEVQMVVDSLQAVSGGIDARLMVIPGDALPPEGATLFTSIGSSPTLVVRPGQLDQERTVFLSFDSGDVVDYPFDAYRTTEQMIAVAGTDTSFAHLTNRHVLPLRIEGTNSAAGSVVTATSSTAPDEVLSVTISVRRTTVSRGWVLAMMAIYWGLALLAASITFLVIRRRRPMETRLLAWLSAMVFALIAFRTAAPGAPPVGTYLDYYAVFESVGIVAASLIALMIFYLVSRDGEV